MSGRGSGKPEEIWKLPGTETLFCTVKSSARARYLRLTVHPEKGIILTVPAGTDTLQARNFLQKHIAWLLRTVRKQQNFYPAEPGSRPDSPPLKSASGFPLRSRKLCEIYPAQLLIPGISCRALKISYQWQDVCWTAIRLNPEKNTLIVTGNLLDQDLFRNARLDFLKRTAADLFLPRLRSWSEKMGPDFYFRDFSVKIQKGRWGSCSSRRTISLNAHLLCVSPELADAVMLHELCHLREMNHSAGFYALLNQFCPDWAKKRRCLAAEQEKIPFWFR